MSPRPNRIDRILWPLVRGWRYAVTLSVIAASWVGLLVIPADVSALSALAIAGTWAIVVAVVHDSRVRYRWWRDWIRMISTSREGRKL